MKNSSHQLAARSIVIQIVLWALFAGLLMVLVFSMSSQFVVAVGLVIGYLCIFLAVKIKTKNFLVKDIFVIVSFLLISGFSVGFLGLACWAQVITHICGERSRISLLMTDFFFVGAPIIVFYLFDRIPRLVFRKRT